MAEQYCLKWNNHQSTLLVQFETLLESDILTDCTLSADGKYLNVHKVLLSACSPYFSKLLGEHKDKHPIFFMKDVSYEELKGIVEYMYKGEVNITQDRLDSFLKTAASLQIKGLADSDGGKGSDDGSDPGGGGAPRSKRKPSAPDLHGGYDSPVLDEPPRSPKRKRRQRPAPVEDPLPAQADQNHCDTTTTFSGQLNSAPLSVSAPEVKMPTPMMINKTEPVDPPSVHLKTELPDDVPQVDVQDLTLDDEDEFNDDLTQPGQPGTSFSESSQDFKWFQQTLGNPQGGQQDDQFMTAAVVSNPNVNQSGAQGDKVKIGYRCKCGKKFTKINHFSYHVKKHCSKKPDSECLLEGRRQEEKEVEGEARRQLVGNAEGSPVIDKVKGFSGSSSPKKTVPAIGVTKSNETGLELESDKIRTVAEHENQSVFPKRKEDTTDMRVQCVLLEHDARRPSGCDSAVKKDMDLIEARKRVDISVDVQISAQKEKTEPQRNIINVVQISKLTDQVQKETQKLPEKHTQPVELKTPEEKLQEKAELNYMVELKKMPISEVDVQEKSDLSKTTSKDFDVELIYLGKPQSDGKSSLFEFGDKVNKDAAKGSIENEQSAVIPSYQDESQKAESPKYENTIPLIDISAVGRKEMDYSTPKAKSGPSKETKENTKVVISLIDDDSRLGPDKPEKRIDIRESLGPRKEALDYKVVSRVGLDPRPFKKKREYSGKFDRSEMPGHSRYREHGKTRNQKKVKIPYKERYPRCSDFRDQRRRGRMSHSQYQHSGRNYQREQFGVGRNQSASQDRSPQTYREPIKKPKAKDENLVGVKINPSELNLSKQDLMILENIARNTSSAFHKANKEKVVQKYEPYDKGRTLEVKQSSKDRTYPGKVLRDKKTHHKQTASESLGVKIMPSAYSSKHNPLLNVHQLDLRSENISEMSKTPRSDCSLDKTKVSICLDTSESDVLIISSESQDIQDNTPAEASPAETPQGASNKEITKTPSAAVWGMKALQVMLGSSEGSKVSGSSGPSVSSVIKVRQDICKEVGSSSPMTSTPVHCVKVRQGICKEGSSTPTASTPVHNVKVRQDICKEGGSSSPTASTPAHNVKVRQDICKEIGLSTPVTGTPVHSVKVRQGICKEVGSTPSTSTSVLSVKLRQDISNVQLTPVDRTISKSSLPPQDDSVQQCTLDGASSKSSQSVTVRQDITSNEVIKTAELSKKKLSHSWHIPTKNYKP